MLEDGAEQGNKFERNLGAVGHGVDIRISDDESDTAPSTFWITNPQSKSRFRPFIVFKKCVCPDSY